MGLLDSLFPSQPQSSDQFSIDPGTGLTPQQQSLLSQQYFGNLGATLLAAGQKLTPLQRSYYLGQLGGANPDPNKISEMAYRNQMTSKTARENAQQINLMNIVKTPEFQNSIKGLNSTQKLLFTQSMNNGDLATAQKILDDAFTPKSTASGGLVYNGKYYDPYTQQITDLNAFGGSGGMGGTGTGKGRPKDFDPTKYGLPEGTEVSDSFFDSPEPRQGLLSDIYTGKTSLDSFGRNFLARQGMETAVRSVFKDYDPAQSQAAYEIRKSYRDKKSLRSLYNTAQTFGTAVRHIASEDGLLEKVDNLKNSDIPLINQFINGVRKNFGDPRVDEFNSLLHTLQGEVGKLVTQNILTVSEADKLEKQLNDAASPAQMKGVLTSYLKLMDEKSGAIDEANQRDAGKLYDEKTMSSRLPETKRLLEKYKNLTQKPKMDRNKIIDQLLAQGKISKEQADIYRAQPEE